MVLYTIPNSTLNRFTLEFLVLRSEVVERLSDRWDPKKSSSFHVLIKVPYSPYSSILQQKAVRGAGAKAAEDGGRSKMQTASDRR